MINLLSNNTGCCGKLTMKFTPTCTVVKRHAQNSKIKKNAQRAGNNRDTGCPAGSNRDTGCP